MNENQIFEKVRECLSGALGVEAKEIRPASLLVSDLGAESIDFIDIIFRLERAFDIKIPSGELFPANLLSEERFLQAGRVTQEGLNVLREKIPYLDLREFEKDPQISNLANHFDVQMVVSYIRDRLAKNVEKP